MLAQSADDAGALLETSLRRFPSGVSSSSAASLESFSSMDLRRLATSRPGHLTGVRWLAPGQTSRGGWPVQAVCVSAVMDRWLAPGQTQCASSKSRRHPFRHPRKKHKEFADPLVGPPGVQDGFPPLPVPTQVDIVTFAERVPSLEGCSATKSIVRLWPKSFARRSCLEGLPGQGRSEVPEGSAGAP